MTSSYRSRATQTVGSKMKNIATSPIKVPSRTRSTSPLKVKEVKINERLEYEVFSHSPYSIQQDSSPSLNSGKLQNTSDSSLNDETKKIEEKNYRQLSLENSLRKIIKKPRFYTGITKECYFLIDMINKHTDIAQEHILLCLKKIRRDTTFSELGDEFGISLSYASKIFHKYVPIIASVLHPFILKNNKKTIKRNLPISFRHKYNNVSCIIDCLEIEIQKPTKSIHQALTWSEYKKTNTIKYLISSTPDGLVNYISPGYTGRISDVLLVENCNFLDGLEPGTHILADRGFKHIEQVLLQRGVKLLRPPSVPAGSKLTKKEARQTKEIASLRIHIERVIRRVREFAMLEAHSAINLNLVPILDETLIIACALINLQGSLIK